VKDIHSRDISNVAIIGGGILGAQIAVQTACFGYTVFLYDSSAQAFDLSIQNAAAAMKAGGKGPVVPIEQWEKGIRKVVITTLMEAALKNADLVIEAIPEDLELKRRIFAQIDSMTPQKAILATNSSTLPISKIEDATQRPEQCLNLHFYMPATGNNLVDIMRGSKTSDEVMEAGEQWITSIGCIPLPIKKESFGFCFNRVWRSVKREALLMWAEGIVDFRDIDRAWMTAFGTEVGPFGLMDFTGLNVTYAVELSYYNESKDERDKPPEALKAMVERGELGVKTGKGFYSYPNPEFALENFISGKIGSLSS